MRSWRARARSLIVGLGMVCLVGILESAGAAPARPTAGRPLRLLVLPLESDGVSGDLVYLERALAESVAAQLRSVGSIIAPLEPERFRLLPGRTRSGGSAADSGEAPSGAGPSTERAEQVGRVDLDVAVVAWNKENFRARLYDDVQRARLLDADILVSGTIAPGTGQASASTGRSLALRLRCFDRISGRTASFALALWERTALREAPALSVELVRFLSREPPVPLSVETEPDEALVFADNRFLGRSPVRAELVPGRYRIEVRREGHQPYSQEILIERTEVRLTARLQKIVGRAGLTIVSDPPGADVYLDAERIGKTPLERRDLPPGAHRVRVSAPGRIDRIVGVELANDSVKTLRLGMRPGHTETAFRSSGRAFLDWTWYDLHFYSLLTTLFAYGSYIYHQVQEERVEESVRWDVPLIMPTVAQLAAAGSLPQEIFLYEIVRLQSNDRLADRMRSRQSISFGAGIFSLLAAAAFLYLDLDSQPETGELGALLRFEGGMLASERAGSHSAPRTMLGVTFYF